MENICNQCWFLEHRENGENPKSTFFYCSESVSGAQANQVAQMTDQLTPSDCLFFLLQFLHDGPKSSSPNAAHAPVAQLSLVAGIDVLDCRGQWPCI